MDARDTGDARDPREARDPAGRRREKRRPVVTAAFASLVSLGHGVLTLGVTQLYLWVSQADASHHGVPADTWRTWLAECLRPLAIGLSSPLLLANRLVGEGDAMFLVAMAMVALLAFAVLHLLPGRRIAGESAGS